MAICATTFNALPAECSSNWRAMIKNRLLILSLKFASKSFINVINRPRFNKFFKLLSYCFSCIRKFVKFWLNQIFLRGWKLSTTRTARTPAFRHCCWISTDLCYLARFKVEWSCTIRKSSNSYSWFQFIFTIYMCSLFNKSYKYK